MPEKDNKFPRDEKGRVKCDGLTGKNRQRCEIQAKKESVQKGAKKALGMPEKKPEKTE